MNYEETINTAKQLLLDSLCDVTLEDVESFREKMHDHGTAALVLIREGIENNAPYRPHHAHVKLSFNILESKILQIASLLAIAEYYKHFDEGGR